jgi:predicted metalloprotease with PDZ domain
MNTKISAFIVALAISLTLHIVLVLSRYKNIQPPKQEQRQEGKSSKSEDSDGGEKVKIWFNRGPIPCDYYVGIGVQFMGLTGIVTHVAYDGPAWKAGLRPGDEFVTRVWDMDLKFGETVDLIVRRNGKTLKLKAVVDRICRE